MIEVVVNSKDPNCPACRMTRERLSEVIKVTDNLLKDSDIEQLKNIGVRSMPYVEIKKDGQAVDTWSGLKPERIKAWQNQLKK